MIFLLFISFIFSEYAKIPVHIDTKRIVKNCVYGCEKFEYVEENVLKTLFVLPEKLDCNWIKCPPCPHVVTIKKNYKEKIDL